MHPEQKRIYRTIRAEEKLKVAMDLYHSARVLKAAALKAQHPEWTDSKIQEKVREVFGFFGS
jgi:DUF1365 family protein